jgi:hypothetical protein
MSDLSNGEDEERVDFFEEADTGTGSERFKAQITNLAREHRVIEGEITDLQNRIKELALRKSEIETRKLPQLLQQAGVKEITTLEGLKVSTKYVVGAIPAESKERAYEWLDEHGHSDIIKRNLALQFQKGDTEQAEKAREALAEMGFDPTIKLDVHPQTFMAFAREQIQNGRLLPLDEWGVWYGDKAVIK